MAKRGGAELFAGDACGRAWRIAGDAASAARHAKTNPANLPVELREALRIVCEARGIGIFLGEMGFAFLEPRHCSRVFGECLREAGEQAARVAKKKKARGDGTPLWTGRKSGRPKSPNWEGRRRGAVALRYLARDPATV